MLAVSRRSWPKKMSLRLTGNPKFPQEKPVGVAAAPAPPMANPSPSRAAARTAEWLEGGLALLDSSRRLTHVSEALAHVAGARRPNNCSGPAVRGGAGAPVPRGRRLLAPAWAEAAPWAEYQFPASRLRRTLVAPGGRLATRPAGLCASIPRCRRCAIWWRRGADGRPGQDAEKVHLRLRLLRAESQLDKLIQCWPGVLFSQRADFSFHHLSGKIEELTGVPPEVWRHQPRLFWDVDSRGGRGRTQAAVPAGGPDARRGHHHLPAPPCRSRAGSPTSWSTARPPSANPGWCWATKGFWLDITRQTLAEQTALDRRLEGDPGPGDDGAGP